MKRFLVVTEFDKQHPCNAVSGVLVKTELFSDQVEMKRRGGASYAGSLLRHKKIHWN